MRRVNTKVSKRIATIVLAAAAAFSLMGCSVEKNFTTTQTHSYTDADGNTTTTTTINHNGDVTTETYSTTDDDVKTPVDVDEIDIDAPQIYSQVPIAIANDMGWDIAQLNIKMSTEEDWSDNLVGEDMIIEDGIVARGITVTYDDENKYIDIHVADSTGEGINFNGVELPTDVEDEIVLSFEYDEADDSFTVYAIN